MFFFAERPQADVSCNFLRSQTPAPLFSFSRIASEFQAITGRRKKKNLKQKEKVVVVHHLTKASQEITFNVSQLCKMLVNIHRNKQIKAVVKVNLIRCFYLSVLHRRRTDRRTDGRTRCLMALIRPGSVKGISSVAPLASVSGRGGSSYLCSCILRVMMWWTSCSMSATVASGASVTHDRGTGFHRPTWIRPAGGLDTRTHTTQQFSPLFNSWRQKKNNAFVLFWLFLGGTKGRSQHLAGGACGH